MEYSKIHLDNYRINFAKTNKFKTINIKINFKRELMEDEITIRRFLSYILLNSSKKYKTERNLNIEVENLYNVGINSNVDRSGNYSLLTFTMTLLNEKYTEEGMIKKSLDFISELLFNPNIKNGEFESNSFELIKKILSDEISSFKDDPDKYSKHRLMEETNPESIISYSLCGSLEKLEEITPQNLYEYYKDVIEKDILDIFVVGDIDEENLTEIFKEIIPNYNRDKISKSHYLEYLPLKKEIKEVFDDTEFNQSKLAISLNYSKLNTFEIEYVMQMFTFIFGGGSESKLFKKVREENSLCYYISATSCLLDRMLVITSGIDSEKYEKVIELIKECLNDMKKGKFTSKDLDKAKIIYINSCKEMLDVPISILNNFVSREYLNIDLLEDKIKKIKKVTKKMIVELSNKIEIDTIYLLKGGVINEEDTSN